MGSTAHLSARRSGSQPCMSCHQSTIHVLDGNDHHLRGSIDRSLAMIEIMHRDHAIGREQPSERNGA